MNVLYMDAQHTAIETQTEHGIEYQKIIDIIKCIFNTFMHYLCVYHKINYMVLIMYSH